MSMKILILTNSLAGLFCFRREVMEALIEEKHTVSISAPFDGRVEDVKALGCTIDDTRFNRKSTNPLKDVLLFGKYYGLIKRMHPDVVLSYTIKPNLYGGLACQLLGVPQMANITGLGTAVENPGWLQKLTILLYKIGMRKTRTTFFQNEANMKFCEKHKMVKGPKVLIPGSGVNITYHEMKDYPPENPIRFIFIGRILKQKGIEEYLDAAKAIKQKYPNTEFHVLGEFEEEYSSIISDLQSKGIVIYHGATSDVRPYISQCHCIVHPSYYPEGMSNVLLEGCAAGRPIITTDRPGCGEIVDDGRNGFTVKQQNSQDLEEKIEKFVALPYEQKRQMGMEARRKVEQEFDRNIVVKAYLSELKMLEETERK